MSFPKQLWQTNFDPSRPTEVGGVKAIWLHQFDKLAATTLAGITAQWPGCVYVKALDGTDWMNAFDASPLAVSGPSGHSGQWGWRDQGWIPWTVPHGFDPVREGQLTAALAEAAGGVILDLEPYAGFWRAGEDAAAEFLAAYLALTAAPLRITLDHRRIPDGFPYTSFIQAASELLPQVYWTDFQRPWLTVLEEAGRLLTPLNKPIEYVLPGNSTSDDFAAALDWCAQRQAAASVWVWQTVRPENWPQAGDSGI